MTVCGERKGWAINATVLCPRLPHAAVLEEKRRKGRIADAVVIRAMARVEKWVVPDDHGEGEKVERNKYASISPALGAHAP